MDFIEEGSRDLPEEGRSRNGPLLEDGSRRREDTSEDGGSDWDPAGRLIRRWLVWFVCPEGRGSDGLGGGHVRMGGHDGGRTT